MIKVRVSIQDYEPWLYVQPNGELGGPLGASYREKFYYILQSFNTTFTVVGRAVETFCTNDYCTGHIGACQSNKADIYSQATFNQLNGILTNLTFGPTVTDTDCSILTLPKISASLISQDIIKTFEEFDTETVIIFIGILGLLGYLLIKNLYSNVSIVSAVYFGLTCFFGQKWPSSYISHHFTRFLLLTLALHIFFFQSIFSNVVQTGLVSSTDFKRFDDIQSLAKSNIKAKFFDFSPCRHVFESSQDPIIRRMRPRTSFIKILGISWHIMVLIVKHELQQNTALLCQRSQAMVVKKLGCSDVANIHGDFLNVYISSSPFARQIAITILNARIPHLVQKAIIRASYAAFESGLYPRANFRGRTNVIDFLGQHFDQNCLGWNEQVGKTIPSSATLATVGQLFSLIAIASACSIIIFLFEICVARCFVYRVH